MPVHASFDPPCLGAVKRANLPPAPAPTDQRASSFQEELLELSRSVTRGFLLRVTKFQLLLSFRCWASLVRGRRRRLLTMHQQRQLQLVASCLARWREEACLRQQLRHLQ